MVRSANYLATLGTVPNSTPARLGPVMPSDDAVAADAVRAIARASRLLERSSAELSLAHYRILSAIAAGDERASRIASRLAVGKPTISAAVELLSQRGLLTRSRFDDDQRVATLALTEEGARLLARVEGAMIARLREVSDRSPSGDQLLQGLAELGAAIEQVSAERHATARGRP